MEPGCFSGSPRFTGGLFRILTMATFRDGPREVLGARVKTPCCSTTVEHQGAV